MKSEPPNPGSENYYELWILHLKDYITLKGGIDRAAVRLHVHPNTLRKIINNMEVSCSTRRKVANILRIRAPITLSQSGNSDKQKVLNEVPQHSGFFEKSKSIGLESSPSTLSSPISILDLSVRAYNCLKSVGITTVAQLVENKVDRLRRIRNMGKKSIAEVIYRLSEFDLKLTDSEDAPTTELPAFILKQELLFQKLKEAHRLYVERGSLEAAGKQLGITRERVRQLLVKGTRLGLFEYKPFDYPFIPKEKILEDYKKFQNLNAVALGNNITTTYLHKLFTAYNITEETLRSARIASQKIKCV